MGSSVVEGGVKAMGIVVAVDESEDFGACIGGVEKKMTTKFKLYESKNPLLDCLRRHCRVLDDTWCSDCLGGERRGRWGNRNTLFFGA